MGPAGIGRQIVGLAPPRSLSGNFFGQEARGTGFSFLPLLSWLLGCWSRARWALNEKALFFLNPPNLQQLQAETTKPQEYRLKPQGQRGGNVTLSIPVRRPQRGRTHLKQILSSAVMGGGGEKGRKSSAS